MRYRLWLFLGSSFVPSLTAAQSVVHGVVRTESAHHPIAGAEVVVDSLKLATRSQGDGLYRLERLPAGTYRGLVRAIGFAPLPFEVTVSGTDSVEIDFELTASVQQLAPLKVEANAPRFKSAAMQEFEEHRKLGFGSFFDRAQLAQLEPSSAADALRRLAGVRLVVSTDMRCRGAFAASSRGSSFGATPCDDNLPKACYLAIYLDGVRIWAPGDILTPPNMDEFQLRQLQAIEIYRGPAETPMQYQMTGGSCGAIVFWSRTGEDQ
jgi:hypothetical protein